MDVHIVGGGPAGSIAALSAARSGHKVVVSEEHSVCGLPENCSGLFSRDGLGSLKSFVDYKKTIINPIHGADVHLCDEKLTIRTKDPIAYVCNRAVLDQEIVANAESEGVKINYGERISAGSFYAQKIIGADGPLSYVARHFGFPKINRYASTLQTEIKYECDDVHVVEVFVSNGNFPGFFGWVIPQDEENAEFGMGVVMPNNIQLAWQKLLRMKNVESTIKPKGWIIPIQTRKKTAMQKNRYKILLAGDAAGQVKSTTGGGVIFGGNCAAIAGAQIDNPLWYELEWRLRFGPDLAAHRLVHKYLGLLSDNQISALGKKLKTIRADEYLSNNGHMDRPTKMVKSQFLLHVLRSVSGLS